MIFGRKVTVEPRVQVPETVACIEATTSSLLQVGLVSESAAAKQKLPLAEAAPHVECEVVGGTEG